MIFDTSWSRDDVLSILMAYSFLFNFCFLSCSSGYLAIGSGNTQLRGLDHHVDVAIHSKLGKSLLGGKIHVRIEKPGKKWRIRHNMLLFIFLFLHLLTFERYPGVLLLSH